MNKELQAWIRAQLEQPKVAPAFDAGVWLPELIDTEMVLKAVKTKMSKAIQDKVADDFILGVSKRLSDRRSSQDDLGSV